MSPQRQRMSSNFEEALPDLCKEFAWIPVNETENAWYPLWTTILFAAFPYTEEYRVTFQYNTIYGASSAINHAFFMVVQRDQRPVFFVEVKAIGGLESASQRDYADYQVCHKLGDFLNELAVPALHGVCAFGSLYAPYTLDKQTTRITPKKATVDPELLSDPAPIERWEHEMQTDEGQKHFITLIRKVKEMFRTTPAPLIPVRGQ